MTLSSKFSSVAFPALVILAGLFFNVANAQLVLVFWIAYLFWAKRNSVIQVGHQAVGMIILAGWITCAQFWSSVGAIGWFTSWSLLALPMAYIGWQLHSQVYPESWDSVRNLLYFLAVILAGWGICQVSIFGHSRAYGPLSDPNAYGCLLNILWFPLFMRFVEENTNPRMSVVYGASLIFILMALMMSGSRTAVLIWFLLFSIMIILHWRSLPRAKIMLVTIFGIASYFLYSIYSGHLSVASYRAAAILPNATHDVLSPRYLMWKSTLIMWLNFPLFGSGLGSWHYIYPLFRSIEEKATGGNYAHNDYLQLLEEGGLLLSLLYIWIIGRSVLQGFGSTRLEPRGFENSGLMAGVVTVLLHATVNFSLFLVYISLLVGLYLGRIAQTTELRTKTKYFSGEIPRISDFIRKSLILFVLMVNGTVAALSSASLSLWHGNSIYWNSINKLSSAINPMAMATILLAIRPADTNALRFIGASLENAIANNPSISLDEAAAIYSEILSDYDLMRSENEYDTATSTREAAFILNYLAKYGSDPSRMDKAKELLEESLHNNPASIDSAILISEIYLVQGQTQNALEIMRWALPHALNERDKLLAEAQLIKLESSDKAGAALDLQQKLRELRADCLPWDCGNRKSNSLKAIRAEIETLKKQ